jgi:AcrR family transcriptional regulator
MDAAGDLFATRHYHEVRMDDIAVKAGVAKGTLYLHFKDKEALYVGLTVDGMTRLAGLIEESLGRVEGAEEKLRVFLHEAFAFCAGPRWLMEMSRRVELTASKEGIEALNRCRQRFHLVLIGVLREHPSALGMTDLDLELAVRCFGGSIKELLETLPQPWPDDLADRMLRHFLRGFRGMAEGGL